MNTIETIQEQIRETPLADRLTQCNERIGKMCANHQSPSMSIPPRAQDDDMLIVTTLQDAARSIQELTQRLIDRQESYTTQTVRIEDIWREKLRESQATVTGLSAAITDGCRVLADKDAQNVSLREALSYIQKRNGHHSQNGEWLTDEIYLSWIDDKCDAALSAPPPPCVSLKDVRPLTDVLEELAALDTGEQSCIAHDAKDALSDFLAKHPYTSTPTTP